MGRVFPLVFPRAIFAHCSARLDLQMFMLNIVIGAMLTVPLLAVSTITAGSTSTTLNGLLGFDSCRARWVAEHLAHPRAAFRDGRRIFLSHRLRRELPWLSEFRKVHHSAPVLNPWRVPAAHDGSARRWRVCRCRDGRHVQHLPLWLHGGDRTFDVMGCTAAYVFSLAGAHLRHSHIWLGYPGWLSCLLISRTASDPSQLRAPTSRIQLRHIFRCETRWPARCTCRSSESRSRWASEGEHGAYSSLAGLYVFRFTARQSSCDCYSGSPRGYGSCKQRRASTVGQSPAWHDGTLLAAGALWAATPTDHDTVKKSAPLRSPAAKTSKKRLTLKEAQAQGLDEHPYRRIRNTLYTAKGEKALGLRRRKRLSAFQSSKISASRHRRTYDVKGGGRLGAKAGRIIGSDAVVNARYPHPAYRGPIGLA